MQPYSPNTRFSQFKYQTVSDNQSIFLKALQSLQSLVKSQGIEKFFFKDYTPKFDNPLGHLKSFLSGNITSESDAHLESIE